MRQPYLDRGLMLRELAAGEADGRRLPAKDAKADHLVIAHVGVGHGDAVMARGDDRADEADGDGRHKSENGDSGRRP